MAVKKSNRSAASVAPIQTEYVQALKKKEEQKRLRKIKLYRRLAVYAVIGVLLFGFLGKSLYEQKQTLAAKEQEKQELLAQYEEVIEEQEILKQQIIKLNDDEYIGKLARKDLFVSKKGEIIFSDSDKKKKEDEKGEGKE